MKHTMTTDEFVGQTYDETTSWLKQRGFDISLPRMPSAIAIERGMDIREVITFKHDADLDTITYQQVR